MKSPPLRMISSSSSTTTTLSMRNRLTPPSPFYSSTCLHKCDWLLSPARIHSCPWRAYAAGVDAFASYALFLARMRLAQGDVPSAVTILDEAEAFLHQ